MGEEMKTNRNLLPFKKAVSVFIWAIKEVLVIGGSENYLFIFFNIVASVIPSILGLISGKLLDALGQVAGSNITISQLSKPGVDVIDLLLITGLLTISNRLINIYQEYLRRKYNDYYFYQLEDRVAIRIASLDLSYFDNHETASLVTKAKQNIFQIKQVFDKFIELSGYLVSLLTSTYFIINANPILAIFVFVTALPTTFVYNKYVKLWWTYRNKNFESIKIRNNAGATLTSPLNITQVRVMNYLNSFEKYLSTLSEQIGLNGFLNVRRWKAKFDSATSVFETLRVVGIPLFLLPNLLKGTSTVGTTFFLLGRANDFASDIAMFFGEMTELFDQLVGASEIKELYDLPKIINEGKEKISSKSELNIEFRNISFRYPNTDRYIFKNLSLNIPKNSEIAIVGINGVGKSTFIKLLLRIYDVEEGEILIDGVNIKEYSLQTLYKQMSVLFQDYNLYPYLSIEENITWGAKNIDRDKLDNVIKLAEASTVIAQSPLGLKQRLDRTFKDGMQYSSGQKQKLAIARLLYREARILILDEPTASIDPVSEYNIFKRIYEHMNNKTVIIISHRFSTVRNAQRIYVFADGGIAEQGSHRELIQLNGIYADAFNKQAEGYTKQG